MNRILLAVAGFCVAVSVPACSSKPNARDDSAARPTAPSQPNEASVSASGAPHIENVLDQWSAGRHEEAVRALLMLSESQAPPAAYRPFDLTERQFAELPQTDRDALREKMLARLDVLRELARELARRARQAAAQGHREEAERLLKVVKRLGAANRGPEVTLVVDLVGQAIERLADDELAELKGQLGRK